MRRLLAASLLATAALLSPAAHADTPISTLTGLGLTFANGQIQVNLNVPGGVPQLNSFGGLGTTATLAALDANLYLAHALQTNFNPTAAWSSINVGFGSTLTLGGGATSNNNGAHALALLGWIKHTSAGTTNFAVGAEGKIDVLAGSLTTPVLVEANFNSLAAGASIGQLVGVHPHVASANGTINTALTGLRFDIDALTAQGTVPVISGNDGAALTQNNSTVGVFADNRCLPLAPSGSGTITSRYCLQNTDPSKVISNAGALIQLGPMIVQQTTPASSSAPCIAGQVADDANYHYACVAANTWKRAALSAF